jgi:hypothetical protein
MTLGNKLAKFYNRKQAFEKAWLFVVSSKAVFPVVGVTFENRQEALYRLTRYNAKDIHTVLVPEDHNPYDAQAVVVKVFVQGKSGMYTLDYIARNDTGAARVLLGKLPALKIIAGDIFGARLSLDA